MIENLLVLIASLFLVVEGATFATRYSAKLAESFRLSKYIVGFIVVAFISILPETLISINAAAAGIPSFGLGTLLGSNVADLSLIFAVLVLSNRRGMKIETRVLKNISTYPLFILLPIVLGFDGRYSRIDGLYLILAGSVFYFMIYKNGLDVSDVVHNGKHRWRSVFCLLAAMALLLIGAHHTVASATALACLFHINPVLIGMLVVSLGTTMPELFFSMKALKKNDDGLAVGNILGAVLADATIVIGILAIISPFDFSTSIIYVTGTFMVVASLILLGFMRTEKTLSKSEARLLLLFWVCYALIEYSVNG